ncbi:HXXEE domain-containing protein [Mycobacterium sp.]|uniref:HXXEE domain-containing protein n=1 Tax=Mycobacterium sp. TaxID=1785 RepID=UPI002D6F18FB|nr:HXXEE domain-containing protein [Mycobacterium sp.]HZA11735.1 HXXEE domain-containing protein [Mycobacterium sp.]
MSALKLLRRHWHDIGLVSAVVAGAYLLFGWGDLDFLQRLLILNFIVVLLHQFEEYSWPGGFPAVANLVLMPLAGMSRYFKPLNQLSSAVANLTFAYVFYLLPVFFPHTIWLGLATVIVGAVLQVIGHAIIVNYQIRSLYSPGVATAVLGWLPLGVVYVYYIQKHGLASGWEWLSAIVYMILAMVLIFYVIEQRILGSENPPYPFEQDEMERFDIKGKLERARH